MKLNIKKSLKYKCRDEIMTKLKELREKRGLSQRELADVTGISVRTLQDYEQGRKSLRSASFERVYILVKALQISFEELFDLVP